MKPKPHVRKMLATLKREGQLTFYWVGHSGVHKRYVVYQSKTLSITYWQGAGTVGLKLRGKQALTAYLSTDRLPTFTNYWLAWREHLYLKGRKEKAAIEAAKNSA